MSAVKLAILFVAVACLAALALHAGLPAIARAFAILGPGGFAIVTAIHVPIIALLGLAWWFIGRAVVPTTATHYMTARLVRDAAAELLPFSQLGGFAAGIRALSATGADGKDVGSSLFVDLVMEFFAKLLYALAGLALLAFLIPAQQIALYVVLTLGGIAAFAAVLAFREHLLGSHVDSIVRRLPFGAGFSMPRSFLGVSQLLPSGILHTLCWMLGGFEAWVTLHLMGLPTPILAAIAIDSLAMGLRTFGFFVPAAVGVQEASYVLICSLFGIGPDVALAFSLTRRGRDLVLGAIGLGYWQATEVKRLRKSGQQS
jgi:putative membrane protein